MGGQTSIDYLKGEFPDAPFKGGENMLTDRTLGFFHFLYFQLLYRNIVVLLSSQYTDKIS